MEYSRKAPSANPEANSLSQLSIAKKIKFLKYHFDKIEAVFEEERKQYIQADKIEQERTKNDEDDHNYNYEYSQALREIEMVYLRMHRYTAILTLYSYLEDTLNQICDISKKNLVIEKSYKNFKGSGIKRAKEYLKKEINVDFTCVNSEWSALSILNELRNCIMHGNGNLLYDEHKERGFKVIVNNYNYFEEIEGRFVFFSSEYVRKMFNNVECFLTYLLNPKLVGVNR
ncbi:hypothetical protein NBRC116188_07420 [Oceaniserpentilla sp. 4NH20-0058]|uniref:hypothetical protein n=1 Tax=Oceaniserpentilla sp. 4NH20-0058 TaxID=3127660 RepID=UPI0031036BDE